MHSYTNENSSLRRRAEVNFRWCETNRAVASHWLAGLWANVAKKLGPPNMRPSLTPSSCCGIFRGPFDTCCDKFVKHCPLGD
jgi:hypothetical protein